MKTTITLVLLLISSLSIVAQEWNNDLDQCLEMAKEKNKKIVLVFSGSDWCAPCMKLEKEIWNSDEFKTYSKANFILLKADFPKRKKNKLPKEQEEKNNQLAEKYNKNGYFPLVIVLDQDAKVLGSTGYKKLSPADYINILDSF